MTNVYTCESITMIKIRAVAITPESSRLLFHRASVPSSALSPPPAPDKQGCDSSSLWLGPHVSELCRYRLNTVYLLLWLSAVILRSTYVTPYANCSLVFHWKAKVRERQRGYGSTQVWKSSDSLKGKGHCTSSKPEVRVGDVQKVGKP